MTKGSVKSKSNSDLEPESNAAGRVHERGTPHGAETGMNTKEVEPKSESVTVCHQQASENRQEEVEETEIV